MQHMIEEGYSTRLQVSVGKESVILDTCGTRKTTTARGTDWLMNSAVTPAASHRETGVT